MDEEYLTHLAYQDALTELPQPGPLAERADPRAAAITELLIAELAPERRAAG